MKPKTRPHLLPLIVWSACAMTLGTTESAIASTLAGVWPWFTLDVVTSNNGDPIEEITIDVPNALLANPALFIRVRAIQP